MFGRLSTHSRPRRTSTCASLWAVLLGFAVLLLLMAVQAPAAGAAGRSVLIVAAHPDDDLLYGAGVVANALAAGDTVKIVYMTNGDLSGIATGLARQDETVNGQAQLGTPENDLIFLGYPDGYLLTLFEGYPASTDVLTTINSQSTTYGDHGLGGTDYHNYRFGSHAAYNHPNVLADLDAILAAYHPDDIYTTSQFDLHLDHEATYDFMRQALLDSMAAEPSYQPTLHQTIVWTSDPANWPLPLDPQTPMTEPPGLAGTGLLWSARESLPVPADMQSTDPAINRKIKAIAEDVSQGGTTDFLGQFVHSDEIFWAEPLSLLPPSGSLTVNGGAPYTATTAVTLDSAVSAVDASALQMMRFRNSGGDWSAWETFAATKSWTLTDGDGSKTVEAEFKDAADNVLATSDTITLDSTPPTVSDDADSAWHPAAVTVHLTAADSGSGIAKTQYRLDGSGTWLDAAGNAFTVTGNIDRLYEYRALDNAGNASTTGTCTVRIDTTKPQPKAPYKASVRRRARVTLKFRVNDSWPKAGKATVTLKIKTKRGKTVKTVVLRNRQVNTLLKYRFRCTLKQGTYRFYVYARDAAGNSQRKVASNRLVVR